MGPRLMLARPWVYGLFNGVVGGLFIGSVLGVEQALLQPDQYSWGDAAIVGLALGVFSATVWGLSAGRRQWRHRHDPGRDEPQLFTSALKFMVLGVS